VLLGAGLDTFAYRNPHPDLRVFELDLPATQAMKRRRLASADIVVPETARLVPVDFAREGWVEALPAAGFDVGAPALFAWLGVTPYLEEAAVLATLRSVLELSQENAIVFDYAVPRSSLGLLGRMAFDAMSARVAKAGEPFRCFFAPERLARELARFGYLRVEDLDGERINDRYFRGRSDGLEVRGRLARFVFASGSAGR
jgi:methyltransferase (TIGR00027 family)